MLRRSPRRAFGARQPDEEPLQGVQGKVQRGLAQTILGSKAHLLREARLEPLRLLDVKRLEVAVPGVTFEAVNSLRNAVERGFAEALRFDQILKYARLIRSLSGLWVFMDWSLHAGIAIQGGDGTLP